MTASSGPGIILCKKVSLSWQEQAPCVIVDIMRAARSRKHRTEQEITIKW
jgi:pyruvate/2-oxoacid:ferredoxin oxidoreductase alpha subunit